jgi:predicted metal-dependent HD superfamily phosphohydrolase
MVPGRGDGHRDDECKAKVTGRYVDRQRFTSLWKRSQSGGGSNADADDVFQELHGLYSEPGRFYHTPEHIEHCLRQLDQAASHLDDPDSVEIAIWFHDLIYDTRASDNEQRSADRFLELAGKSMDSSFKSKVHDLIMVTVHPGLPQTSDQQFMVDIDLSSFGLPWEDFVRDSDAVRGEFPHLADTEFFPRHRAFVKSLLSRPNFYFTDFFRSRLEKRARSNIQRYLDD